MNSYLVYRGQFLPDVDHRHDDVRRRTSLRHRSPSCIPWPWPAPGSSLSSRSIECRQWGCRGKWRILAVLATWAYSDFEYKLDDSQLMRSLGHWLVYLQLIMCFLPKTAEDDWLLFTLGLMQVLIGAVISQSEQIGTWLFLWAMLAIWVLGQFFLQREARRFLAMADHDGVRQLAEQLRRPLSGLSLAVRTCRQLRVMATTLAVGGLIFLVLPRQAGATRPQQPGGPIARHLTGFDEEVQLGQLGEILENDTVVMTVELSDEDGKTIRPDDELLWRGVTLLHYEKGRWRRQSERTQTVVKLPPSADQAAVHRDPPGDQARAQRFAQPSSPSVPCGRWTLPADAPRPT